MKNEREWSPTHDQLRDAMQKEISVLRELLANLFQEEIFLSQKDTKGIFLIQEDRSNLLKTLSVLRKQRLVLTKHLKELLTSTRSGKKLDFEHLLPPEHENTSQVLSLRDQMRSLFEKMNTQKVRNHFLHHEWAYLKERPLLKPKKKKSAIATFEQKQ